MFSRSKLYYTSQEPDIDFLKNDVSSPAFQAAQRIPNGSKVLDIGAGNGVFARILHANSKDVIIDGIEPSPLCPSAKDGYRFFYVGEAERIISEINVLEYDYIVMLDVLEHLNDPYSLIETIYKMSSSNVVCIFSFPNISHGSVILSLIDGNFDYEECGLLDKTHIRFFTKKSIIKMCLLCKFYIVEIVSIAVAIEKTDTPIALTVIGKIVFIFLLMSKKFTEYQYVFVLTKTAQAKKNQRQTFISYNEQVFRKIKLRVSIVFPSIFGFVKKMKNKVLL